MKSTLIGIYSPKTSGATIIGLNMAIAHQMSNNTKSVAIVQLSAYPNIHFYAGCHHKHDISEIIEFQNTSEWGPTTLEKISVNNVCDIFQSPYINDWKDINCDNIKKILEILEKKYDTIYFDIHYSLPTEIFDYIYQKVDYFNLIATIDPVSIDAVTNFLEHRGRKNTFLILNQCPSSKISELKCYLNKLNVNILGILREEIKTVWHNVYEGIPVMLQKKSKLKKQMENIVKVLIGQI